MTRVPGTASDRGHTARKIAFYAIAALLFLPHCACAGAARLDELITALSGAMHRWSHPCLYSQREAPGRESEP